MKYNIDDWEPPRLILVFCEKCDEWMGENETKFENIEEDVQGRDVLTFKCPDCKTKQKSIRIAS
jgi:hypothetical protein